MALTHEVPRSTEDEDVPTPVRRRVRRRTVTTVACAVVVALAAGSVAWGRWDSQQTGSLRAAMADAGAAFGTMLDAVADGQDALEASDGRVLDESVRTRLADLVGGAAVPLALPDDPSDLTSTRQIEVPSAAPSLAPVGDGRGAWTDELERVADAARRWTATVVDATTVVTEAQTAWELEQANSNYDAALAQLAAAVDGGTQALAASEGKVADDAVRQALATLVGSSTTLRDATVADEVDDLTAAAGSLNSASTELASATNSVMDAQAAWQAEQDRLAAEQAATAAQASAGSARASSNPSASTSSGGATASESTSSASGTSASGGQWVVTEAVPLADRCADEFGNAWDC